MDIDTRKNMTLYHKIDKVFFLINMDKLSDIGNNFK